MNPTPVSLLERLRQPFCQDDWTRFVQLYTPVLYQWARRLGLRDEQAADLLQDVFVILVQKLPEFHYDPQKTFRGWLRALLVNRWRNLQRRRVETPQGGGKSLSEPACPDPLDAFTEAEFREHLVGRALELMRTDFQPATWQAFWEYVVNDRPAAAVAAELGLSVGAVYLAKMRVLSRLREELAGLLD